MTSKLITLVTEVAARFIQTQKLLTTAESCTGGGLGYFLTEVPGSSGWYERGFITYSNESKMEMLQVNAETLNQFGAVSEQTAREMAEGALKNSRANFSIAITGIAGPDGGTPDKPVGTVWMAFASKQRATETMVELFHGNRSEIRVAVIQRVLEHILTYVS